jgi:hypothetical protein
MWQSEKTRRLLFEQPGTTGPVMRVTCLVLGRMMIQTGVEEEQTQGERSEDVHTPLLFLLIKKQGHNLHNEVCSKRAVHNIRPRHWTFS